jgi:hypothetical protein
MPVDRLLENDTFVWSLSHALHEGSFGLGTVPSLLKQVIEENRWQERRVERTREIARFESFEAFVCTNPPDGLGSNIAMLRRICTGNEPVLRLLKNAMRRKPGQHKGNQYTSGTRVIHPSSTAPQDRTDKQRQRLDDAAPALYQQVLEGERTITSAAVAAGIYPHRVSVNLDDPESAARTLQKHASPEFLAALRTALASVS